MIYLIDDKKSRQEDYGWTEERFAKYSDVLVPIWNIQGLKEHADAIPEAGNIVLYHESFPVSVDKAEADIANTFDQRLKDTKDTLHVAYFSGSKYGRNVRETECMLPPSTLYENLELFIDRVKMGDINFQYLAFGKNFEDERLLLERFNEINGKNVDALTVDSPLKLCFALTSENQLIVPVRNAVVEADWDFFDSSVTDDDLCDVVEELFNKQQYDALYIPLWLGNTLSDFMGLRLAMHIRLTKTCNQYTPIFIYGVASSHQLASNECFDALKLPAVSLVDCSSEAILRSLERLPLRIDESDLKNAIDRIAMRIPTSYGDNHSVANKWAMYRWLDMLDWGEQTPEIKDVTFQSSLYFKYLTARFGEHDKHKKAAQKYPLQIEGIAGKHIVYIDDEYNKGWEELLEAIFERNGASFHCYRGFDKKMSLAEQVEDIKRYVDAHDADCYLLDLRLHEDDFKETSRLSGHEVAEYIKSLNHGNQIVVFTASNKVWNMKQQLLRIGAVGYVLKESPDLNLKRKESQDLYKEFANSVKQACKLSYTKALFAKQEQLSPYKAELDFIPELLLMDGGNNDSHILGAVLLGEITFVEDFVEKVMDYSVLSTGKDHAESAELVHDGAQETITGRIFFKRQYTDAKHQTVVDIDYSEEPHETESGWCDATRDNDITRTSAALLMGLHLPPEVVREYVNLKRIRNTQVAHGGKMQEAIRVENLVRFYFHIICPCVESMINN
jgi:CheY-like chemotaxis protein